MYKILDSDQMKLCDTATIDSGIASSTLMERASKAVFECAIKYFDPTKTIVIAGAGNNGGDGLITAILLHQAGYNCDICYVGGPHKMTIETMKRYKEAEISSVPFVKSPDLSQYTLIIDAIFGTGISSPPDTQTAAIINKINQSEKPVLSIDIPSGINASNGKLLSVAVIADMTVTMQTYKRGLVFNEGIDYSGKVIVADLGISTDVIEDEIPITISEKDLSLIPKRRQSSHKGTYGRVLIIASSYGMCGAAYLSALAAYRSGAGIVEIFCPEENRQILQTLIPEAIISTYTSENYSTDLLNTCLERSSCVVIGPGLGKSELSVKIVKDTYNNVTTPIIVDADALNITAENFLIFPSDVPVIITPHPMEMSRLVGQSVTEIMRDPVWYAQSYSKEFEIICVLKTARTIIVDKNNVFINTSGSPSLAKGGSGDVLTGVIAGMLCQDLSPIGAATLGTFIHGKAGELLSQEQGDYSPLAREIANAISKVLRLI